MFGNLKSQANESLKGLIKIIQQSEHQLEDKQSIKTKESFLDHYDEKLETDDKILIKLLLKQDLKDQCNFQQFKNSIRKVLSQIQSHQNQSKNQSNVASKKISKKILPSKLSDPSIDHNPQYFRINHQIMNKLFDQYKLLEFTHHHHITFEDKIRQQDSLSYNKILMILKQIKIQLDVTQKLQLLRSIKKYSFNQNFINREQFSKVYKYMVHGMAIKQQNFIKLVQAKEGRTQKNYHSKEKQLRSDSKKIYLRIKTEAPIQAIKSIKIKRVNQNQTHEPKQSNQKVIQEKKQEKLTVENQDSYLVKAMQRKKVSKLTWQILSKMNQSNKNHQIVIPDFIRRQYSD